MAERSEAGAPQSVGEVRGLRWRRGGPKGAALWTTVDPSSTETSDGSEGDWKEPSMVSGVLANEVSEGSMDERSESIGVAANQR